MTTDYPKTGAFYSVTINGKDHVVRLTGMNAKGGWDGIKTCTGRKVHIKDVSQFQCELEETGGYFDGRAMLRPARRKEQA